VSENKAVWNAWKTGIIVVLVTGVPLYFGMSWQLALLFHIGLVVIYALLLRMFSSGFIIEGGVLILILSIGIAINVPLWYQVREKARRIEQRKLERRQAIEGATPKSETTKP
jgi:hypothetical protein